ncbi:MAG: EVE domain-containing protein [Nitrospirae bacterium]|nr:MAG: EVE domain-containing protein [Nitrospirota bacterium]
MAPEHPDLVRGLVEVPELVALLTLNKADFLRDEVRRGDLVLVYHSSVRPAAVAGIAEVVREGYPDPTQFDPESPYFDPRATPENPRWVAVDIRALRPLEPPVTRDELRGVPELAAMMVLRRGSRLSIQPVTRAEWAAVLALRGLDPDTLEPR